MPSKDPEKIKAARRATYHKYKERYSAKVQERKRELKAWFNKYKRTLCCERCPEDNPVCLDFHHNDATKKDFILGQACSNGYSRERIMAEAAKCTVLCANCHRKEHEKIRSVM